MALIHVENASLQYPIYGTSNRSLKKVLLNISTGGNLLEGAHMVVVEALKGISFSLTPGDRLGLIGHNGAGKSTLLRVLAGIYEPTTGKVTVEGNIATLLDMNLGIDPDLTGYENIKVQGLLRGLKKKVIRQIIPDIVEFTEMGDFLSLPVKTYSTGMNLRLAFAIATALTPEILIMDEAIAAGDAAFRKKAQKKLEQFIHHADILVVASHADNIIRQFCNKVMWLNKGEIKAFGDTNDVLAAYNEANRSVTATQQTQEINPVGL